MRVEWQKFAANNTAIVIISEKPTRVTKTQETSSTSKFIKWIFRKLQKGKYNICNEERKMEEDASICAVFKIELNF